MKPLANLLAACIALTPLCAQTQTRNELVQGQLARLTVTNALPSAVVTHWLGFQGIGRGLCFPKPFEICLDLPGTPILLGLGVADTSGRHELAFPLPSDAPLIRIASQQLSLTVPTIAIAKTNALDSTIRTLGAFDDEFSGTNLSPAWRFHDASMQTHTVAGGELRMRPTKTTIRSIWFEDNEGPFLYRLVRGDFTVETALSVVDPTRSTSFPPAPTCRVGGLMVRDPASKTGSQNWIYVLIGGGITSIPLAIEDKTTVDSKSQFNFWPVQFWSGKLRMQRRGKTVSLSYQPPGKTEWTTLRSHDRPDFPATLQVGMVVFSLDAPPNVEARFDEIRFSK